MSIIIGIDCGLSGAVCVLQGGHATFIDTPVVKVKKGHEYDITQMRTVLRSFAISSDCIIALEKQQAMPAKLKGRQQGGVSTFKTGYGYGLWTGIIAGLGMPYELIHPATWKRAMMFDQPKDKNASIIVAKRLFPDAADDLKRVKDHGRADALLIAEFLRRRRSGIDPKEIREDMLATNAK